MTPRSFIGWLLKGLGLVVLYVVLMALGTRLFPIPGARDSLTDRQNALVCLVIVAALDTLILGAIAWTSRLRGLRLYAMLVPVFWGVKTFTSEIEAIYFMPNVSRGMFPSLLGMTVPLALVFPAALMAALGRFAAAPGLAPAWRAPGGTAGGFALRVGLLAAVVYPVLFFAFGYFVAWQSPALRAFYGQAAESGMVEHFKSVFSSDHWVWAFESMRGLLWIAFALPILRTTRGPAWLAPVLVGLLFCFVQNDVHLLPNWLMPPEVRLYHFIETGSSNFLWALVIGWVLGRSRQVSPAPACRAAAA